MPQELLGTTTPPRVAPRVADAGAEVDSTVDAATLVVIAAVATALSREVDALLSDAGESECANPASPRPDCAQIYDAAVRRALEMSILGAVDRGEFGVSELLSSHSRDLLQESAVGAVIDDRTGDPSQRIAALVLITRAGLAQNIVDARMFDSIERYGTTEILLRLDTAHYSGTLPAGHRAIRELAENTHDARVQRAALSALGHAHSAEPLGETVRHLVERAAVGAPASPLTGEAARAISRCGAACSDLVRSMLASTNENERMLGYHAIVHTHGSARETFASSITDAREPSSAAEAELRAQARAAAE